MSNTEEKCFSFDATNKHRYSTILAFQIKIRFSLLFANNAIKLKFQIISLFLFMSKTDKYKLHQNQVSAWKKDAIDAMSTIFQDKRRKDTSLSEAETQINELQRMVGQLTMERDWLKKKSIQLSS